MNEERTLYERVWKEPRPKGPEPNHPVIASRALETYAGAHPAAHVSAARDESSIPELIDQLEAWDTQQRVNASQPEGKVLLALEALEVRIAQLQSTPHQGLSLPQDSAAHLRDIIEEVAKIAAELTNQMTKMHIEIERRLQMLGADVVKRVDRLEASMRKRDLTFIESLVTMAELSWRKPDQHIFGTPLEGSTPST